MKKLLSVIVCLFLGVTMMMAQTKTVQGVVLSGEDGEPIIGASVVVTGTTTGTVTDIDGNFSLKVADDAKTLTVSFVGMESVVANILNRKMEIVLNATDEVLDEVMVVAYGTQKKSSFTGAASTIKAQNLQKMQVSNLSKSLEGAVAGVQISSSNGSPGSSASIIIRGLGSISSSQSPLIVLDGVAYEGSLNSIPTQDIESMTILKDAAANSMYGARGSNGVIIITTKGSKAEKAKINFDARFGFNTRGVQPYDVISDAGEYYEMYYEAFRNQLVSDSWSYYDASNYAAQNIITGGLKYNIFKGVADNNIIDPQTGHLTEAARNASKKWNDNWSKDPFDSELRQEYNFNVSGGNEMTRAYASFSYLKDGGYVVGSGFDRLAARVKVDQNINKNIKVGANVAYTNTKRNEFGDTDNNYSNIFMFSQQIAPIYPIYRYDEDGNKMYNDNGEVLYDFGTEKARPYAAEQNPFAVAKVNDNEVKTDNLSARGYFDAEYKGFRFTANVAYDLFNTRQSNFATPNGGDAANVGGRLYKYSTRNGVLNANQLLSYTKEISGHNIYALVGHETNQSHYEYMYGHMTNFADPNNHDFSNATVYQGLSSYTTEHAIESFFGKVDYNYSDKYYFTASLRRDASSRFHKDNRWGTFWALGASWRLDQEEFMKSIEWIEALKIKASYGTQGNENIGLTKAYEDLYEVQRVGGEAAFVRVLRGNPDLTWEKSNNFNVGFESDFLGRIRFNADFFIKETKDMLYQSPIPVSEGAPNYIWRNEMDMKNTGIEFDLSADIYKSRNLTWTINMNGTHYKNELTRLPDSKPASEFPDGYQAGSYWRKLGGSLYDWYLYDYAGVNPETGESQFREYSKDENGNEVVNLVNTPNAKCLRETGKSAIPDFIGGLGTTVNAFGFDLSIQTAFQFGGYVYDSFYQMLMTSGSQGQNFHRDMFNRWTPTHRDTDIPALKLSSQSGYNIDGDWFLTKASYFSLRNITLGYTLPKKLTSRANIDNLRFYLVGDNIWMHSARKGLDPRQSFSGATGYIYSALSSYSFGVSLSF